MTNAMESRTTNLHPVLCSQPSGAQQALHRPIKQCGITLPQTRQRHQPSEADGRVAPTWGDVSDSSDTRRGQGTGTQEEKGNPEAMPTMQPQSVEPAPICGQCRYWKGGNWQEGACDRRGENWALDGLVWLSHKTTSTTPACPLYMEACPF